MQPFPRYLPVLPAILLIAVISTPRAEAQVLNPACQVLPDFQDYLVLNGNRFKIGPSNAPPRGNCTKTGAFAITGLHLVGSPSGLADTTGLENHPFAGLTISLQETSPIELWAVVVGGVTYDAAFSSPGFNQLMECFDEVQCDDGGTPQHFPYIKLEPSTGALLFPACGPSSDRQLTIYIEFGTGECGDFGYVGQIPMRSVDLDSDGDCDEHDEAMLEDPTYSFEADLNWDGVFNDTDRAILAIEMRRRVPTTGQRYGRGACQGDVIVPYDPARLQIVPPSAPGALSIARFSGSDWKFQWTAGGDDGTTGKAYKYEIRTSTTPITSQNFAAATPITAPVPAVSGTVQSVLYPLTCSKYFAIRAIDNSGEPSSISTIPVPSETVGPATTTNLSVVRQNDGSPGGLARLQWTSAGDDGNTGLACSYDIRFAPNPINSATFNSATPIEPPAVVAPGTTATLYYPMDACTRYYFALKTVDKLGNKSGVSNAPTVMAFCQAGARALRDDPSETAAPPRLDLAVRTGRPDAVELRLDVPSALAGASAKLVIYDILGRRVATLLDGPIAAGSRTETWNMTTDGGKRVPVGTYGVRFVVGEEVRSAKFQIVR